MFKISNSNILYFYYGILLLVLMSWTNTNNAPITTFRILYIAALLFPLLFVDKGYTPIVFTIFATITLHGYSFSYMPTDTLLYDGLFLILILAHSKKRKAAINEVPSYLWVLLFVVPMINIIMNFDADSISQSLLALVLLLILVPLNDERYVPYLYFSFTLISIVLSIFYFTAAKQFTDFYFDSGIERSSWMDPNYMSTVMGMGVITAILALIDKKSKQRLLKFFYIVSIGVSIMVMIMLASRGGLLATVAAMLYLLLFSKVQRKYKWIGTIALVGFLVLIYNSGYFELLQYRLTDEGNLDRGSNRFDYWELKLREYFNEPSILTQIFGIGYRKSLVLGSSFNIGFHNDFIAFLVQYGVIGLILLLTMLISPITKASVFKRETIACVIYLAFCGFTLEPLSSGRLSYYFFYLLIIVLSRVKQHPILIK